jgi:hypothetical protein
VPIAIQLQVVVPVLFMLEVSTTEKWNPVVDTELIPGTILSAVKKLESTVDIVILGATAKVVGNACSGPPTVVVPVTAV